MENFGAYYCGIFLVFQWMHTRQALKKAMEKSPVAPAKKADKSTTQTALFTAASSRT